MQFANDVSPVFFEFVAELFGHMIVIMFVSQSYEYGDSLPFEADCVKVQKCVQPMGSQLTRRLKLDGKDETLRVFKLPVVHTLDADGLSTQLVGYILCYSLTTVVHDDD